MHSLAKISLFPWQVYKLQSCFTRAIFHVTKAIIVRFRNDPPSFVTQSVAGLSAYRACIVHRGSIKLAVAKKMSRN